ncbi:MAG: universal stress protein [Acidimicrobiia bacterium]
MYAKVLIATDGSPTADRAVERGLDLAARLGSEAVLLAVAAPEKAKVILDRTLGEHAHRRQPITTVSEPGDPANVILDVVEALDADLVIVGNKGMQGPRRFLLSSIPNKVAHHARCAVLIVKTT